MTNPDFPEPLRDVIRRCIPDIDAVEILLMLSRDARKDFELSELAASMRPGDLPETAIRAYLTRFCGCGLVVQEEDRYRFAPSSPQLRAAVLALARLYNERPVTLVRTIYALRDDPVRAFSDAFRLKR